MSLQMNITDSFQGTSPSTAEAYFQLPSKGCATLNRKQRLPPETCVNTGPVTACGKLTLVWALPGHVAAHLEEWGDTGLSKRHLRSAAPTSQLLWGRPCHPRGVWCCSKPFARDNLNVTFWVSWGPAHVETNQSERELGLKLVLKVLQKEALHPGNCTI